MDNDQNDVIMDDQNGDLEDENNEDVMGQGDVGGNVNGTTNASDGTNLEGGSA